MARSVLQFWDTGRFYCMCGLGFKPCRRDRRRSQRAPGLTIRTYQALTGGRKETDLLGEIIGKRWDTSVHLAATERSHFPAETQATVFIQPWFIGCVTILFAVTS